MVAQAGTGVVRIIADTSKLSGQVASGTEKAMSTAGKSVSRFSSSIQTALSSGLVLAATAVAGFIASAVRSASEHEDALVRLRVAIGGATEAFEEQATSLQSLTGYQDESILLADAALARFQLTRDEIHSLIPLILDYATATGVDAVTAASNFGRALLGNARGMKSLGISFQATGDRTKDLAALTALLEDRVKGTAEALGQTFSGRVRILGARFDDLKEEIGNALLPALEDLVDAAMKFVDVAGPLLSGIFQAIGDTAADLADALEPVVEFLGDKVPDATNDAADSASNLQKAWELLTSVNLVEVFEHFIRSAENLLGIETEVGIASLRYAGNLDVLETNLEDTTGATKSYTEALQDQRDAQRALLPGTVGLIGRLAELRDAQRELNRARRDSETTAAELRDRELAVLEAQLGLQSSFADLIAKQRQAGVSTETIIGRFEKLGEKAGLSKGEIAGLIEFIQRYIDKLAQIPDSVVTRVNVQGGPLGPGSPQQLAEGFHGVVRRPTLFMAGEAGPERLDVTPMGSGRSARVGGGGPVAVVGTLRVDWRSGLAELQGELDWRDRT